MISYSKHTSYQGFRKINLFQISLVFFSLVLLILPREKLYSQVISNEGAIVTVTSGVVVESKDFENNTGTVGNEGIINLSGKYLNALPGVTGGNGFYNLKGDWVDFGTFNEGTSLVTFNGTSNQAITHGTTGEKFYNLTVNNPGNFVIHDANPGSTLTVSNNLNVIAGTLGLGLTTAKLDVLGNSVINGTLSFHDVTTQISNLNGNLSGSGTIDMSGGSLSHLLNLLGATNSIGTFTTSPLSLSTVDYKGTNQTVFPTPNYRNLIISNSGIKTLQGNSTVGADLTVSAGTFDLGTTTTSLDVIGATSISGSLSFNGNSTKVVSLGGDLSGAGVIDMSGSSLSHLLNLYGALNSIGTYTPGGGSTVDYIGAGNQEVFTSNNYRNLRISGGGEKILDADISASGILSMFNGDINSNGNILKITNPSILAINRTAGKVIGKLQRAVDTRENDYLYPVGAGLFYNPLKIKFQDLTTGPLIAQFLADTIGNVGLPLDDDGNEVWQTFTQGYWSMSAVAPMASGSYSINLNYNGFAGVDSSSRIVKRSDGGPLVLDGKNGLYNGTDIERDTLIGGISLNTVDFGIGKGRPKIVKQPENIDVCEGSNAFFEVKARGHGKKLTYQWQVNTGSGFTNITNGGVYSGATSKELLITPANYGMNGYYYRVIVTDGSNNSNISTQALLTVNKIPIATVTPDYQVVCDGQTIVDVVLGTSNNVVGTTFYWTRTNPDSIATLEPLSDGGLNIGDVISGSFTNYTDHPVTIVYTVTPTGPVTTHCVGNSVTFSLVIQPTPRIYPVPSNSVQCDSTFTYIELKSPSTFTSPEKVTFRYTVVATGGVTGFTTPVSGLLNHHVVHDFLVNPTTSVQTVRYTFTPVSPFGCNEGPSQVVEVSVNPTPRINAVLTGNAVVCDTASIVISFTTGNPSIIGEPYYKLETSYTNDVGGVQTSAYYPVGTPVNDVLVNNTKNLQYITYRITPVFRNVQGTYAFDCQRGIDTTIVITLNPTPVFDSVVVSDTVICNESSIHFDFYNTQITTGTVIYELVGTYSAADISGVKPDGPYATVPFTDNLTNSSTLIQNVTYLFKPVIDDPVNGLYCNKGINTSKLVKVVPTLIAPAVPHQYIGGRNIRCFGESNGSIDISPSGGYYLRDYFYTWTKGGVPIATPTIQDPSGLNIGEYKYKVEDIIGCSFTDSVLLTQPAVLNAAMDSIKAISCLGNSDGAVYITPSGGSNPYRFEWKNDQDFITYNEDLINARHGDQRLTMRDTNNCAYFKVYTIIIPNPMQITFDKSQFGNYNISCNGASDGYINTHALGNGSPANYEYFWTNDIGTDVPGTADIFGLVKAEYYLFVVDSLGCQGGQTVELTEPDPIKINRTGQKHDANFDISCFGRNDGIVNLSITGGHTSYLPVFYDWTMVGNPGYSASTRDINGLYKGVYTLNIQDTYSCMKDTFFTLIEPPEMILDTTEIYNYNGYQVSCKGFNNSYLNLDLTGGYGGYNYTWSSSTPGATINNPNTLDQAGLKAGGYRLDVLDGINCPAGWDFTLTEPDTIAVNPDFHMANGFEISCFGGADGTINLNTAGGVPAYEFTWTSSDVSGFAESTENLSGLTKGNYTVNIKDQNECLASWTYTLSEPEKLVTGIIPKTISCFSTNDGAADLTVNGGVLNYSYLWNNGETTEDITSLYTGKYYVDITDANNCKISDTTIVAEPPDIIIKLDVPLQYNGKMISCYGASDAVINSEVSGGVGGFRYNWSPGAAETTGLTDVPAGLYNLVILDGNDCAATDSILVEQPLKLKTGIYETNPTCYGKTDGQITLIVQGGTPDYSIKWNTIGQQGQTADNIGDGKYDVVIKDLNNCEIDTFGTLIQPQAIQLSKEINNPVCPDIYDGFIQYQVQGGTAPYDLELNKQKVNELVSDLGEGTYRLVITDNNQCVLSDTSKLKAKLPLCITVPNAFSPNGDGVNDTWVIDQIEIYPNVKIEIYNRWGELIYYAANGYTKPWNGTYKGRDLPIDSYYYVIDLRNGRDVITGNITIIR